MLGILDCRLPKKARVALVGLIEKGSFKTDTGLSQQRTLELPVSFPFIGNICDPRLSGLPRLALVF